MHCSAERAIDLGAPEVTRAVIARVQRDGTECDVPTGDVVVAGANFGCGSSREHAPLALKGAGVSAVVAESFARIFFRNAINTGLPIVVSPEAVAGIDNGDEVIVDAATATVRNLSKGTEFRGEPMPEFVQEIAAAGGLVPFVKAKLERQAS